MKEEGEGNHERGKKERQEKPRQGKGFLYGWEGGGRPTLGKGGEKMTAYFLSEKKNRRTFPVRESKIATSPISQEGKDQLVVLSLERERRISPEEKKEDDLRLPTLEGGGAIIREEEGR